MYRKILLIAVFSFLFSHIFSQVCGNYCIGELVTINSNYPGSGVTYSLVCSDGFTSSSSSASYIPSISGTINCSYTVTKNNCDASENFQFVVNDEPEIVLNSLVHEFCNTQNGSIDISVTGGTGSITYIWSNSATTQDISNLANGTYSVTVTDTKGCFDTETYTINDVGQSIVSSGSISGGGSSCGTIDPPTLTLSGQSGCSGSFSYQWQMSQNNGSWSNVGSGLTTYNPPSFSSSTSNVSRRYRVRVSCNNGCAGTLYSNIVTYTALEKPTASLAGSPNPICQGSNITLNMSITNTTTGPYDYFLYQSGSTTPIFSQSNTNSTSLSYTDVPVTTSGFYILSVRDANNCSSNNTFFFPTRQTAPSLSANTTNAICGQNGSINLSVSGGTGSYSYNWSNSATTQDISNLSNGTYTVTVTSGACTSTASYTVSNSGSVVANAGSNITVCETNLPITLTGSASGGTGSYSYSWSPTTYLQTNANSQSVQFGGASPGSYNVTLTVGSGTCTDTDVVTVTVQDAATSGGGIFGNESKCGSYNPTNIVGGSVNSCNSPNYQWQQNTGSGWSNISGATAQSYDPSTITVTTQYRRQVSCQCGTTYSSNTVTKTVKPNPVANAGTYEIICLSDLPEALNNTASGGGTYFWSTPAGMTMTGTSTSNPTITSAAAGNYALGMTVSINGCFDSDFKNITIQDFQAGITANQTICSGQSTTISASPNSMTYNWGAPIVAPYSGDQTILISPTSTTTYTVTVTNANGCSDVQSTTVTVSPTISSAGSISGTSSSACGTIDPPNMTLSGQSGCSNYNIQWQETINSVSWVDISGAQSSSYNPSPITASSTTISKSYRAKVSCNPCNSVVLYTAPKTYTSYPEITDITIVAPTTAQVGQSPNPTIQITGMTGGTGSFTCSSSAGGSSCFFAVASSTTGTKSYPITVTDANGCTFTKTHQINWTPACPTINATITNATASNQSCNQYNYTFNLSGVPSGSTVTWSTSSGTVVSSSNTVVTINPANNSSATNVTITAVINPNVTGCPSTTVTYTICIPPCITARRHVHAFSNLQGYYLDDDGNHYSTSTICSSVPGNELVYYNNDNFYILGASFIFTMNDNTCASSSVCSTAPFGAITALEWLSGKIHFYEYFTSGGSTPLGQAGYYFTRLDPSNCTFTRSSFIPSSSSNLYGTDNIASIGSNLYVSGNSGGLVRIYNVNHLSGAQTLSWSTTIPSSVFITSLTYRNNRFYLWDGINNNLYVRNLITGNTTSMGSISGSYSRDGHIDNDDTILVPGTGCPSLLINELKKQEESTKKTDPIERWILALILILILIVAALTTDYFK